MTSARSFMAIGILAHAMLAGGAAIGCYAWNSSPVHEQMNLPSWRHMISSALENKGLCSALIMICSALLPLLLLLSPICHGEITEAAPGQPVGGRLTLESDGGADIFLEAPDSVSDWVLVPSASPNLKQMAMKVTASTDWQMTVSSDRQDGRMAEYDLAASEYVTGGRALESPLRVSSVTDDRLGRWSADLPDGGMISQGEETSEDGRQVLVTLGQRVSWTDEPLEEGQAYRIALTFTVSPSG